MLVPTAGSAVELAWRQETYRPDPQRVEHAGKLVLDDVGERAHDQKLVLARFQGR